MKRLAWLLKWTPTRCIAGLPFRQSLTLGVVGLCAPAFRAEDPEMEARKYRYYAKGFHHGKASGHLLYELAQEKHGDSAELLWCAIVSLTDQQLHMRITREAYAMRAQQLEACLEHPAATALLEDGTRVPVAADSHIRCECDAG